MDSKQLLDSLADHLALYHTTPTTAKSQSRQRIVQWISSLTTEQRQAALTVVDESWIAILLQMQKRIQTDGQGFFIVLPDVPVSKTKAKPSALPSLCYRKSKGLLARVNSQNEAEQILSESLRIFSSEEGEASADNGSACSRGLDSVTASEDLVKDLDRFIAVMDTISDGEFLNTTTPSSASSWEELPWLKAKGYYSLPAFVANKLELSLRLSWLNSHDKKRTPRMNSSAGGHQSYKNGRAAAGFASNVFWRKKGCVDWWYKVDSATKAKAFKVALVKATKFEVKQLVGGSKDLLKTEMHSNSLGNQAVYAGKFSAVHKINSVRKISFYDSDFKYCSSSSLREKHVCGSRFLNGLYVLQQVSALGVLCTSGVPENDNLFFSTLSSVHTVLDGIMRRVRDILAKVSKDLVELDLLGDENVGDQLNHCKAKDAEAQGKEKRRKGRSRKKKISMTKTPIEDSSPKQQLCLEQKQRMLTKEDNGRGTISIQTGPGTKISKPRKEPVQSLICQEENMTTRSSLQTDSVRERLVSGCSEGQVNDNKQGRHRSNSKNKDTRNFNAALLSDDIERQLGNGCDEAVQHAASFSLEKKVGNSLQCINSNCTFDVSREEFCPQHVNQGSSVHGLNDNNYCDEELVKHSETMVAKELLPKTTFQDDGESSNGSTYEKPPEIPIGISHLPNKSDASDINDSDLQNTISARLNLTDTDMGDTDILLRDCGSSSPLVETSCDNYFDGRMLSSVIDSTNQVQGHGSSNKELRCKNSGYAVKPDTHALLQMGARNSVETPAWAPSRQEPQQLQRSRTQESYIQETMNFMPPTSYEWPSSPHFRLPAANAQLLPAATDRLHLDGDLGWRHRLQPSLVPFRCPRVRQQSGHGGYHKQKAGAPASAPATAKIIDWSPAVQTGFNLTPPVGYLFESGFIPLVQPSFQAGCTTSGMELNGHRSIKEDAKYEVTDDMDYDDLKYLSGDTDDFEGYVISEDEAEKISLENQCNGADYNQVFGGGVMYWNTADYAGTGYSRPPSLSSEDSSWARHEADLNVVIDDLISLPQLPGPYGNSGVASPPTTFRSSFDQLGTGTPTTPVGFVKPGNDFNGKFFSPSPAGSASASEEQDNGSAVKCAVGIIEGMKGEALPCPILRPIVIPNVSRKGSRTEFACHQESRSPCVPCNRRETPRMKRPPSPVVLCVPPAPPPPPPSPVGAFRKQRGFPTVRSGSSSPRHWGLSSWVNEEEMDHNDSHVCTSSPEVVGFTWKSKCITGTPPMHPLPSALLCDRLISIPQLALEQEHPDIALPLRSVVLQNKPALQAPLASLHNLLHEEIEHFCKQVAAENLMRKPFVNAAVKRVARSLQVLWPRSRTKIFGSNATGLALPTSDVDLVVCLPPVRNLEPIKEAGILEGRNGIKETCLQHAARYLADQEWVKSDSLKTIENTAIPIIILVVKVHSQHCGGNRDCRKLHSLRNGSVQSQAEENVHDTAEVTNLPGSVRSDASACKIGKSLWGSKNDRELVRLDISFESSSHTGLQTAELVRALTGQFPVIVPLALVMKQFLTDRSLDHPYSGGLSSYCLVLLITRFLQHQHNTGHSINQNLGSLFMDFLYFFGCVFDPRQMRVSIRGGGMYVNRDRGQSIDPLHIDDPLHQANNVGRNCFRIHQCIKAFADAHSILETELLRLSDATSASERGSSGLLQKIIPSVVDVYEDKANF